MFASLPARRTQRHHWGPQQASGSSGRSSDGLCLSLLSWAVRLYSGLTAPRAVGCSQHRIRILHRMTKPRKKQQKEETFSTKRDELRLKWGGLSADVPMWLLWLLWRAAVCGCGPAVAHLSLLSSTANIGTLVTARRRSTCPTSDDTRLTSPRNSLCYRHISIFGRSAGCRPSPSLLAILQSVDPRSRDPFRQLHTLFRRSRQSLVGARRVTPTHLLASIWPR